MDLVSGNTYWTKRTNIPRQYPYLMEDIQCDVVIVGAGVSGAICSYYFSETGDKIVVVDKNIVGYGSTSASTSILQYEIDIELNGLKDMTGINDAVKSFKLSEKAVYDIEKIITNIGTQCGFKMGECFYYTDKHSEIENMKKEFNLRKEHGFSVQYIDEEEGKRRFSFPIKAGIYSTKGAAIINPYDFTHGIFDYVVNKGVSIYENTEIKNIENEEEGVLLTTNNGFNIKAKKVIMATGYESGKYIQESIAYLTKSYTIVTKPIIEFKGWHNQCIIRDTEDPYTYLRVTPDSRIIIGGEDMDIGDIHTNVQYTEQDAHIAEQKYTILENRLKNMFPEIKDIEVEYKFNGVFADTGDTLPYIGEYKFMPNTYFCLGYGANGIVYAVFGAQMIRDLYLGNNPKDVNIFRFGR